MSILQVALPPHHEGVVEMGGGGGGWGNLPRLLGDFTPLFLFKSLVGLLHLRLALSTLAISPMSGLSTISLQLVDSRARAPGAPTRVAAARDRLC